MIKILDPYQKRLGVKTVIVFGCARSGTSAVAGLLRELGVRSIPDTHPLKHESSPVSYLNGEVDLVRSQKNVDEMDSFNDTWGWKSPKDLYSFSKWISLIRNPHFVVVVRSPLDTMISISRREKIDLRVAAQHVGEVTADLGKFICFTPFPLAIVGFEDLVAAPGEISGALNDWLGTGASEAQLRRATQFVKGDERGYHLVSSEIGSVGDSISEEDIHLDQTQSHAVMYGAVSSQLQDSAAALIDDTKIAREIVDALSRQISDFERKRLEKTGLPEEKTGLPERVQSGPPDPLGLPESYGSSGKTYVQCHSQMMSGTVSGRVDDDEINNRAGTAPEELYHILWFKMSRAFHERVFLQRQMDQLTHERDRHTGCLSGIAATTPEPSDLFAATGDQDLALVTPFVDESPKRLSRNADDMMA